MGVGGCLQPYRLTLYTARVYIIYSAIKNKGSLPFAMMWMDLEGVMLSEVSRRKTNTCVMQEMQETSAGWS